MIMNPADHDLIVCGICGYCMKHCLTHYGVAKKDVETSRSTNGECGIDDHRAKYASAIGGRQQ